MNAPDWDSGSGRFGGYLTEIPKPHVRQFPGPRLRRVRLSVSNLFLHYHVSLVEDDNPLWNGELGCWQKAWDDEGGRGRYFLDFFDTYTEAKLWIAKTVVENFPGETHVVNSDVGFSAGDDYVPPEHVRVAQQAVRRARVGD